MIHLIQPDLRNRQCLIRPEKGMFVIEASYYLKEVNTMTKKMMFTALGLGAAYLLKNKKSRAKLMNQIQSFTGQTKAKM
jgi:hypothetical protein